MPHRSAEFISSIVQFAPQFSSVTDLYRTLKIPGRTVRYHLLKDRLPKAERWFDGSRLLHAQLELQRDPTLEPILVAWRLGYVDDLSLSARLYDLFGVTTPVSRKLLGLEWRFQEWLRRSERECFPKAGGRSTLPE